MKGSKQKGEGKKAWPSFIVRVVLYGNRQLVVFAHWLGRKTAAYSRRKQLILLLFFTVAFIMESSVIIYRSFQKNSAPAYSVTPIRAAPLLKEQGLFTTGAIPQLERIHRFKVYLDSLSRSEGGRVQRDRFLLHRPHLMDTVLYLETLYNEQFKNKTNAK